MNITYINTTELEEIAKQLIEYAGDFESEINSLFTRFSDVPYITKEWVGNKSEFYFNRIGNDKQKYITFANNLRQIGYEINKVVSDTQNCMARNDNEEGGYNE